MPGKPHIKLRADAMFPGFAGGAHHGASTVGRDVSEWYTARGSADGDTLPDLSELIPRARDIRRNNGFAQSIVSTAVEGIVGTGIRFCSQPDYLRLQSIDARFTKEWAEEFAAKYEAIFHEWWWSTACHAGDTKTGDMLTEEVLYAKFDNGGSLTLAMWLPKRGDGFATKLQTVEIDRLSNPNNAPNTTKLRGGVARDDFGMPLGYHVKTSHPGDGVPLGMNSGEWEYIPRRTPFGRLRVIHDFDGDRADQSRGKPLLSAVLDQFKNIDRYVKAEIQAALMNAMIWGAITTPLDHEDIVDLFKGNAEALKARVDHKVRMQSGTLATLFPGDKLESFLPQRPAAGFGVFVENIEKIITVATGIPHILSKKDFAKSNYSNTRAALADAYRGYSRRRDRLGAGWLDPSNALLMEEVVNDGRIDAPRFYEFKRAYLRGMWIGPTLVYIDKENEVKGDILSVNANMDTLERIAASRGMNWREMIDQRATEIAYCKKKGVDPTVVIPGDPTKRTVPGVDPNADPNAADNATTESAPA
jgi:lambda family phage portal protein